MTTPYATTPTPLPILLIHKSRTHARRLDQVVEVLQREERDHLRVGVVASLANTSPAQARAFLGRFNTLFTMLDLRLVDPAIAAHRDQLGTNPKLPHLQGPWPATPKPRGIRAVLNLQRELGATALLTPTGLVRDTDADQELERAFAWVRATRQLEPDAPLLVNLTLPSQWLSNPDLRHRLLNELVESTEPMWYLRVRLPAPRPAHSQPRNEALLRGYQELGKVATSEGRQVILATSGLTGWLATSLGAAGFGAGTTPATRTFAEPTVIPQQPEAPWPKRPRYFEPALLHTVDLATHELLVRSKDYTPCECPFCAELGAADPKRPPDKWNGELAGLHHLLQLGRLLARLHTTDPQTTARHQVEQARAFHASLPPFPTHHDNQPLHLKSWAQLLQ